MSITTSFILQVNTQFKRDPADITNDLLKVMYIQMIAQSNRDNNSIPPADPDSFFQQSKADHDAAVIQNALLYTSLSISILVSLISLVSKLWLVNWKSDEAPRSIQQCPSMELGGDYKHIASPPAHCSSFL